MSLNKRLDKEDMVHLHKQVLLYLKKYSSNLQVNLDGP